MAKPKFANIKIIIFYPWAGRIGISATLSQVPFRMAEILNCSYDQLLVVYVIKQNDTLLINCGYKTVTFL
jgi:hypothetical protein